MDIKIVDKDCVSTTKLTTDIFVRIEYRQYYAEVILSLVTYKVKIVSDFKGSTSSDHYLLTRVKLTLDTPAKFVFRNPKIKDHPRYKEFYFDYNRLAFGYNDTELDNKMTQKYIKFKKFYFDPRVKYLKGE